jgi:hypothetical protein
MKNGDFVMFTVPLSDEEGVLFQVLEMRGDRAMIEAQVDMNFKPTQVNQVEDLEVVQ